MKWKAGRRHGYRNRPSLIPCAAMFIVPGVSLIALILVRVLPGVLALVIIALFFLFVVGGAFARGGLGEEGWGEP